MVSFHKYTVLVLFLLYLTLFALPTQLDSGFIQTTSPSISSNITFNSEFTTLPSVGILNLMDLSLLAPTLKTNTTITINLGFNKVTKTNFYFWTGIYGLQPNFSLKMLFIASTGDPCQISSFTHHLFQPTTTTISTTSSFAFDNLKFDPSTTKVKIVTLLSRFCFTTQGNQIGLSVKPEHTCYDEEDCSYRVPLEGSPLDMSGTLKWVIVPKGILLKHVIVVGIVHTIERNGKLLEMVATSSVVANSTAWISLALDEKILIGKTKLIYGMQEFLVKQPQATSNYEVFVYLTCEINQYPTKNSCQCVNTSQILTKESKKDFCKPCELGCQTCIEEKCLSCTAKDKGVKEPDSDGKCGCVNGFMLAKDGQVCECPEGFEIVQGICVGKYPIKSPQSCASSQYFSEGTCQDCHASCLACNGPSSRHCTKCDSPRYAANQSCICPPGLLEEGSKCAARCDPSCKTCEGSEKHCTSCHDGNLLSGSTCVHFPTGFNQKLCWGACRTCKGQGPRNCTSCDEATMILKDGVCECKPGTYQSGLYSCDTCDKKCKTCEGSSKNCTSCHDGNLLSGQTCVDFPTRFDQRLCWGACRTCKGQGPKNCTSCYEHHMYLKDNVCLCNPGTYFNTFLTCDACDPTCLTCWDKNSRSCYSCDSNLNRVFNRWSCVCKDGYFENKGVCQKCDDSCLTCNGEGKYFCTKCDEIKNRKLLNGECKCRGGWREEGKQCVKQG